MTIERTERATILVAEDDPEIRVALGRILRSEGYEATLAADGAAALATIDEIDPALVLLDVMMPIVDGLAVCRRLRERGDRRAVLMLTARAELGDRVAGLDAGADDYVVKPFELDELLARVRALLRRTTDTATHTHDVGPIHLDAARRFVSIAAGGATHEVELTRTEFAILELLVRNAGIVLERSTIYERVWGYDFGDSSRSLDAHVGYLRRKLEATGAPRCVETVRGVGFVVRDGRR